MPTLYCFMSLPTPNLSNSQELDALRFACFTCNCTLAQSLVLKSCYPHQQKRELRLSFLLVRTIVLQNLLNAAGVGSRQRLSHCHANDGPCPSRQTCRFACETFEQGETCSTCPVNYTTKEAFSVLPFSRFLGFFHHFGRKIVLFKKLSTTVLTVIF